MKKILHATWPAKLAEAIALRIEKKKKNKAILSTGFGPSGMPHLGTVGECIRTNFVGTTFKYITGLDYTIIVTSDDKDPFRRIPSHLPNQHLLLPHLQKSLSDVVDPYNQCSSLAAYNNKLLREMYEKTNIPYSFISSTDLYASGKLDEILLFCLKHYDKIADIIIPSVGTERQKNFSIFLPRSPVTKKLLQVPILKKDCSKGTITFEENGKQFEQPVTGGQCKLCWKLDWVARWICLDVDFEMFGKDLIDSCKISDKICTTVFGQKPPIHFVYELFLDAHGNKISKSKGNDSIGVNDWLECAPIEALKLFMYISPTKSKSLRHDIISRMTDEYIKLLATYHKESEEYKVSNPVWYIHEGNVPNDRYTPFSFGTLVGLLQLSGITSSQQIWQLLYRYDSDLRNTTNPFLSQLVEHALNYCKKFLPPAKKSDQITLSTTAKSALRDLMNFLKEGVTQNITSEDIQNAIYNIGHKYGYTSSEWFKNLYEIFLGTKQGPRLGTLIVILGIDNAINLINNKLHATK